MGFWKETKFIISIVVVFVLGVSGIVIYNLSNKDEVPPVITINEDFLCDYVVNSIEPNWLDAIADVSDNNSTLTSSDITVDSTAVDMSTIGDYKVLYKVVDKAGNEKIKELFVHIVLPEAPVINLVENFEFTLDLNALEPDWKTAIDSIVDNKDTINMSDVIVDTSNVNLNIAGAYTLKLKVIDSDANETEVSVAVTVEDNINPTINLDNDFVKTYEVGSSTVDWTQGIISVEDNTDNQTLDIKVNTSIDMNSIGEYLVEYVVTDINGNSVTKSIIVTIVDTAKPVLTVNPDFQVKYKVGDSLPVWVDYIVSASDEYDGVISKDTIVVKSNNVDFTMAGKYQISYEVADLSGNKEEINLNITVGFYSDLDDYFQGENGYLLESRVLPNKDRILAIVDYTGSESAGFQIFGTYLLRTNELGDLIWINDLEGNMDFESFIITENNIFIMTSNEDYGQVYMSYNLDTGTLSSDKLEFTPDYYDNFFAKPFTDDSFLFEVKTTETDYSIYRFNADGTITLEYDHTKSVKSYEWNRYSGNSYNYGFKNTVTNETAVISYNTDGLIIHTENFGVLENEFDYPHQLDDDNYYYTVKSGSTYTLYLVNTQSKTKTSYIVDDYTFLSYTNEVRQFSTGELLVLIDNTTNFYLAKINLDHTMTEFTKRYTYSSISNTTLFKDDLLTMLVEEDNTYKIVSIDVNGEHAKERVIGQRGVLLNLSMRILDEQYILSPYRDAEDIDKIIIIDINDFSSVIYSDISSYYTSSNIRLEGEKLLLGDYVYNSTTSKYKVSLYVLDTKINQIYFKYDRILDNTWVRIINYDDDYTYIQFQDNSYNYTLEKIISTTKETINTWNTDSIYDYQGSSILTLSDGSEFLFCGNNTYHLNITGEYVNRGVLAGSKEIEGITYYVFAERQQGEGDELLNIISDDGNSVVKNTPATDIDFSSDYSNSLINLEFTETGNIITIGLRYDYDGLTLKYTNQINPVETYYFSDGEIFYEFINDNGLKMKQLTQQFIDQLVNKEYDD